MMQRGRGSRFIAGALATVVVLALACGGSEDSKSSSPGSSASKPSAQSPAPPTQPPPEPEPVDLVAQGRSAFMANCTACHNMNPTQPGSIGPAIAGSSLELLEGKVLRNEYPPGYTPKRDTRAMIPLPHLEAQIPALYAYLSQAN
jgi:mono/diheme cytochrome c family protein